MKPLIAVLTVLFLVLQYKLWFEGGGVRKVAQLQQNITAQTKENNDLTQRNSALLAEVSDLKKGQAAVEERARNDLGMIKPEEVFYQVVTKPKDATTH
jgi:cell division protein FtsB